MKTRLDKHKDKSSLLPRSADPLRAAASEGKVSFVDNRPEAVVQQKLNEMANGSRQIEEVGAVQSLVDEYAQNQTPILQRKENNTGLPDQLKSGIESLSGLSMDDVKVHRNSDKPAQLQAHAYAQGTEIHLAHGQEEHLPHEAWHVVQQKQGRVKPTMQMKGKVNVNDEAELENEADVMGRKALQLKAIEVQGRDSLDTRSTSNAAPIQRLVIAKDFNANDKEVDKKEGPPFQLATIQFEGSYDLNLYKSSILDYLKRMGEEHAKPVIEMRAYDSALPEAIEKYLHSAGEIILSWGVKESFSMRYKTLRDETMKPDNAVDETPEKETQDLIGKLPELELDSTDKSLPGFLGHNKELMKPKDMMGRGEMMIPAPEFTDLSEKENGELEAIWQGKAKERYSLHVRQMAKLILNQRAKSVEKPPRVPRLNRSNSIVRPDTLTITNLVAGDEDMTRGVVLQAVQSAFAKGVKQVLLTVEHTGTSKEKYGRISYQIDLLRKSGFDVDTSRMLKEGEFGKAQQSGIRKDEPGDNSPARSVLRITPEKPRPSTNDARTTILEQGWLKDYLKWYQQHVHENTDDAMEYMSITGLQYLTEVHGYK
jgi:hypothetical protein